MDRLIEIEDLRLRQQHDRPSGSGLYSPPKTSPLASLTDIPVPLWATTNQGVAAFVHSLADAYSIIQVDTHQLGRDRGFRFIFSRGLVIQSVYQSMLESDSCSTTWIHAKDMYKIATMIRREQTRSNDTGL